MHPPGEPSRDVVLVDGVSLSLPKGRVLGLIGESGAGKSTIGLSAMAFGRGGVRITGGEIFLNGARHPQGGDRWPAGAARAGGNLRRAVGGGGLQPGAAADGAGDRDDAAAWLGQPGRGRGAGGDAVPQAGPAEARDIRQRYPHQVSGGQLQRAMTAMALCPQPDLVVFDEPTTALDVTTQIDVLAAIKEAIRDTGVAALYITHDLAVVAQIADEIMVLRHGKMVEHGETGQIIHRPVQDYTSALVSVRSKDHPEKPAGGPPVLSIEGVTARYPGVPMDVLKNVSVALEPGHTLAVVGESGSGKSTLARAITGLLPPLRGAIRFAGRELSAALAGRTKDDLRELQMIYQMADVAMNPRQTVGTIIGRPLEFYFGMRGGERDRRVQDLLDEIEMGKGFADRYPAELSGGQKQRVCIARALAAKPKLIICDEVTSALDPLVAEGILKLLLDLQAREGVAYLFITHDLATVKSIADSIAVMYRGEVVRYGPKSEVLAPPFDDYTDLLLSSVPEMRQGWLEEVIAHRKMESAGN